MDKYKQAIAYFEDAIKETDEIIADCTPELQAELIEQKGHFVVALEALHKQQPIFDEQKCRVCGCTWNNACPGGCYWVEEDLCSQCRDKQMLQSRQAGERRKNREN